MDQKVLETGDYELINQLSLAAKIRIAGLITGEQRSPIQGGGIEFADYREYQPGDDIRQIDWSVFLRLQRLLIKLCAEEKELTLMALIDTSRSMRYGSPDKLWLAGRLAAILAGIALRDGNRAGVLSMGSQLNELVRPERSRASLAKIVNVISRIEPDEEVNPEECIRQFATRYSRRCMAVLISDLLFPEWPRILNGLASSGCESYVIQLLAPEEIEPPHLGEVTLVDLENLSEVPLHINQSVAKRYRTELAGFIQEVRQNCHRKRLGHTMVTTDMPLPKLLHTQLRKEGLVC